MEAHSNVRLFLYQKLHITHKNMKTRIDFNRLVILAIIVGMIFLTAMMIMQQAGKVEASAPSGLSATATTSPYSLASRTVITLQATTTNCAARIVSTTDKQIMLTFTDLTGQSPSATFGHMQVASTTVIYDGGQYGCGLVKVWADAATNITFTDSK